MGSDRIHKFLDKINKIVIKTMVGTRALIDQIEKYFSLFIKVATKIQ